MDGTLTVTNPYYGVRRSPFKRQYFEQKISDIDRRAQLINIDLRLTNIYDKLTELNYYIQVTQIAFFSSWFNALIYNTELAKEYLDNISENSNTTVTDLENIVDLLDDIKTNGENIYADTQLIVPDCDQIRINTGLIKSNTDRLGTLTDPQPVSVIP